ncbi:ABC transporter permease [Paenibacillus baekrokdamisoli]|uniref:ABC transporter permease n=2 Tax=Paenibacillus baekrokdamisoli TaxID=1712516 RepID=A0A3G9JBL9_9BACL|nr:ABC transporter permease [Paenibacillus baekrokdamisoli]
MNGFPHRMRVESVKPKRGSIWSMYKRMFFHVRGQWKLLLIAAISIIAVSLLEFVIPQLSQYTIDRLIPNKRYDLLIWIALGVLVTALLLALFNYLSGIAMASVGQKAVYDLRNQLYSHLQSLDIGFFDRNRTGDLMSRVTSDVGMLQQLVSSGMMSIVTDTFTFAAVAIYMLWMDWQLTLIILATFPFMILTTRFFSKRIRAAFKKIQQSVAEVTNHLQDTLSSIRLMKAFSTEQYETERFADRSSANRQANLDAVKLRAIYEPIIDMLNFAGLAIVLILGAKHVMDGGLTVGTIVAFLAYLRLLQNPIRRFSRTLNTVQQSAAAYERIVEILETKSQVMEKANALELGRVQGHVVFHDVSFAYQPEVPVLEHFDFELLPGKVTAIVGASGAGKSTITHLITRFYDPQQGMITIDGHPLPDIQLQSLRRQMGIVSQDVALLNGTIRDNISYGTPHATDAEIEAAAHAANAHTFITSFPLGYEAQIGERGVKLSGGQKQRISIARAILKDPRLIILDEATSALDTESEKAIQDALVHLLEDRTSLVIAHRLSTIQRADRIYVLDQGKIIEAGTHDSLLAQQGKYKQLYELQFPQKLRDIPAGVVTRGMK